MNVFRVLSVSEQVAEHLHMQICRGIWTRTMPGGERLARELGVGRMAVEAALSLLQNQGVLEPQGWGQARRINLTNVVSTPSLMVGILLYAPDDSKIHYIVDLQHRLLQAGHSVSFAPKTLVELGMDVGRIARIVEGSSSEAWIVSSGSREVLEWFANQHVPTFAFAGRRRRVPIASFGPDKVPAMRILIQRLVSLGHVRIVMLARKVCRNPPGAFERAFLEELEAHGIGYNVSFNLPEWHESASGLQEVLDRVFRHGPPTALIIQESYTFIAAQQYLAQRGILAPRDVSLICDDPDPAFVWCRPTVAHINWDSRSIARRAMRWAANVASGKEDRRRSFTQARFVEGGTVGPAPPAR